MNNGDNVNHPSYYGGEDNPYEVIKVLEAWDLGFHLSTCIKYLPRAGKKDLDTMIEDLEKAKWYLNRKIQLLKKESGALIAEIKMQKRSKLTIKVRRKCYGSPV